LDTFKCILMGYNPVYTKWVKKMELREIFDGIEAEGEFPRITYHPGKDFFCVDFTTSKRVPRETIRRLEERFKQAGYPLHVHTERVDLDSSDKHVITSALFQAES